jgi:hypothetical protein
MRSPAIRVLSEYKTLIVKMGLDMTPTPNHRVPAGVEANFDYLVDLEVLLSLCCIMPLFECCPSAHQALIGKRCLYL